MWYRKISHKTGKKILCQNTADTASSSEEFVPDYSNVTPVETSNNDVFEGIYWVPEHRISTLDSKFKKLNNQMIKLQGLYPNESFVPATYTLGEVRYVNAPATEEEMELGIRAHRMIPYRQVTVSGSAPKLNGWNFIARVLHGMDDNGQPINTFMGVPGKDIPSQYRTVGPACEHCGHNRNRKDTFILEHPEHGVKQVGSSCLSEFLGTQNPQTIASYLSYIDELRDSLNEREHNSLGERHINAQEFDAIAAFLADNYGYTSHAKAEDKGIPATSKILKVMLGLYKPLSKDQPIYQAYIDAWKNLPDEAKDEYIEIGKESSARAKAFKDLENPSDFQWNLAASTHGAAVDPQKLGLRAYAPADMYRERKQQEEAKLQNEQFSKATPVEYGSPGDNFVTKVKLLSTKPIDGHYGLTILHRFQDPTGRILSWFSSGKSVGESGETFYIKGKIKKFENYQGQDQISITNVKRLEPDEIDENGNLVKRKK